MSVSRMFHFFFFFFFFFAAVAGSKRPTLGRKVNLRRLLKTRRKLILTKRLPLEFPLSLSNLRRYPLRRKLIPLRLRIQRFKISLAPLKRMLKRSRAYRNLLKGKHKVGRSGQANGNTITAK